MAGTPLSHLPHVGTLDSSVQGPFSSSVHCKPTSGEQPASASVWNKLTARNHGFGSAWTGGALGSARSSPEGNSALQTLPWISHSSQLASWAQQHLSSAERCSRIAGGSGGDGTAQLGAGRRRSPNPLPRAPDLRLCPDQGAAGAAAPRADSHHRWACAVQIPILVARCLPTLPIWCTLQASLALASLCWWKLWASCWVRRHSRRLCGRLPAPRCWKPPWRWRLATRRCWGGCCGSWG